MKPFVIATILIGLLYSSIAHAQVTFSPNIHPITDSKFYLGTTSPSVRAWLRVIADSFYDTDASDGCATWSSNVLTSTGSACGGSGGGAFAWDVQSWGVSTSTTLGFLNGFLSTASSTLASTTVQNNLTVGGTIYGNVTGNLTGLASLATALNADGANCSSGSAPLGVDASGASQDCFDVWTEAENTSAAYTPQSTTLTIAGTADQITSSAGAQDLSTNRTWTLSLPNKVIFPIAFNSTYGTTTYASSTALTSANLFAGNFLATGSSTLQNFTFVNATGSQATTTNFAVSSLSSALVKVDGNGSFLEAVLGTDYEDIITAGDALTRTGNDIDFDGGASPGGELGGTWGTPTINDSLAVTSWNLTTPTLTSFFGTACTGNEFLQDIGDTGTFTCAAATGGSSFGEIFKQNPVGFAFPTTTALSLGVGASTTDSLDRSALFQANATGTTGTLIKASSTAGFTGNYLRFNDATGARIFSVESDGDLVTTGSTTLNRFTATHGTTTQATSTNLAVTNLTSALILSGADGSFGEYAGSNCAVSTIATNIGADGELLCASINNNYWSGVDLAVTNGGTGLSAFGGTGTVLFTTAANTLSSDTPFVYISGRDNLGIGTSTPRWALQVASSTGAQFTLSDPSVLTVPHWSFRNAGGQLFLATSSPSTYATSSNSLFSFRSGSAFATSSVGYIGVGTTSPFASFSIDNEGALVVTERTLATSTAMTVDWRRGNAQVIRMGSAGIAVTFRGYVAGSRLLLTVCSPNGTAGALSFATEVLWAGGTMPAQTTTANACDAWSFYATNATSSLKVFGAATNDF